MNLDREQQISLLILIATFKSLNEQLYNLKGAHSGIVKRKIALYFIGVFLKLLNT